MYPWINFMDLRAKLVRVSTAGELDWILAEINVPGRF